VPVRPLSLAFRAALIAALATLFYARTIDFAFAYDDDLVVLRNPAVTGHAWGAIATAPYHQGPDVRTPSGLYRPLTLWSLAANHVLSADRPWSYHLANVLLHAAAAALVLVCGEAVGLSALAATAGAAVFAIHPVHVEAVANVSGRAELLATLGFLGSFLAFARCRNPAGRVTVPGQFATCGLGAAALAAKENAITFVAVAAAWEALRPVAPGSPGRRRVAPLNLAPSLVLAGSYLALRLAVLGGLGLAPGAVTPIENPVVGLAPLPRAWTVLATFGRAVSLLVTPVRLAPDYGFAEIVPVRSLLDPGAAVGLLFFLACLAGIAIAWRARPELAFVGVLGLATWSIVSNAFVTIGTILGDRLLYLPSVAVCLLAGAAIAAAVRRFRWRGAGVPVAAAGLLLAARDPGQHPCPQQPRAVPRGARRARPGRGPARPGARPRPRRRPRAAQPRRDSARARGRGHGGLVRAPRARPRSGQPGRAGPAGADPLSGASAPTRPRIPRRSRPGSSPRRWPRP